MADAARATITGSTINGNTFDGLFMRDSAQATLERSEIAGNGSRGIALFEEPCFDDVEDVFTGSVTGFGNVIPGPDEEGGNRECAVCPEELAFLTTAEGGELDRRE